MIDTDNKTQAEGLVTFFENLARNFAGAGGKLATNAMKNPGRVLERRKNR